MAARAFISYSHRDDSFRARLDEHLAPLAREGLISVWNDRRLRPGEDWDGQIRAQLAEADIVLCLLSCAFFASDYCWCGEMALAMERHRAGSAVLIPIVCRPCDWEFGRLGTFQALPPNGVAISSWRNRDDAYQSIARALRQMISARISGVPEPTPRRITIRVVLECDDARSFERLKQSETVAALQTHLREATSDEELKIRSVTPGSIVIEIESTEAAHAVFHSAARFGDLFGELGSIREISCPRPEELPIWYRAPMGGAYVGSCDEAEGRGTMSCQLEQFGTLPLLTAFAKSLLPPPVSRIEQSSVLITRRGRMFYAQSNLRLPGAENASKILTNEVKGVGEMLVHISGASSKSDGRRLVPVHTSAVRYLIDKELLPLVRDGRLDLQGAQRVTYVDLESEPN